MKRYEYDGQFLTVKELSAISGIKPHTLRDRLRRGYPVYQAVQQIANNDSVEQFCNASFYEDWLGKSIADVHYEYWKWCVTNDYHPLGVQPFSRHLFQIYPILHSVPQKRGERNVRIIRMR